MSPFCNSLFYWQSHWACQLLSVAQILDLDPASSSFCGWKGNFYPWKVSNPVKHFCGWNVGVSNLHGDHFTEITFFLQPPVLSLMICSEGLHVLEEHGGGGGERSTGGYRVRTLLLLASTHLVELCPGDDPTREPGPNILNHWTLCKHNGEPWMLHTRAQNIQLWAMDNPSLFLADFFWNGKGFTEMYSWHPPTKQKLNILFPWQAVPVDFLVTETGGKSQAEALAKQASAWHVGNYTNEAKLDSF